MQFHSAPRDAAPFLLVDSSGTVATPLGLRNAFDARNRTVAVIDSCEIPGKHNYNNSVAVRSKGINRGWASNYLQHYYVVATRPDAPDVRRFSIGRSRNSRMIFEYAIGEELITRKFSVLED